MFTDHPRRQPDQHEQGRPRTTANILRAVIEFMPGGRLITQALGRLRRLREGRRLGRAADRDARRVRGDDQGRDQPASSTRWAGATSSTWAACGTARSGSSPSPIDRLIAFGKSLVDGVIQFIKDAILQAARRAGRARPAAGTCSSPCSARTRSPASPFARNADDADRRVHEADRPGGGLEQPQEGATRSRARGRGSRATLEGLLGFVRADPRPVHRRRCARSRSSTS